ncbi:MAG: hypothetical protein Q7S95_00025 [bacterium]|nr:hypothetical protein [bacterium]
MSTISIPISSDQERFINSYIKEGKADNKAQVVRRALSQFAEEEAIRVVLEAAQEVKDGKIIRGDIREILKRYKKV